MAWRKTLTSHLNSKQSSIARDGRRISIQAHIPSPRANCASNFDSNRRGPLRRIWPLPHHSRFELNCRDPREKTRGSWSVDDSGGSSAPLKYDWKVLEGSFEFNERRLECLCARNLIRFAAGWLLAVGLVKGQTAQGWMWTVKCFSNNKCSERVELTGHLTLVWESPAPWSCSWCCIFVFSQLSKQNKTK